MGTISTILKCSAALGAFAAVALWPLGNQAAADDPGRVVWSGVYLGASLGGAWGDASFVASAVDGPNPKDLDGGLAGGFQLGIQRQWGHFVAGLEVSALFADLDGRSECDVPTNGFACSVNVDRIWMIGPRLGFAASNLHFYGTGGYALGRLASKAIDNTTGVVVDSGHGRHSGWYLGGGVEWSLGRAMVLGVEYRRIEFDDSTHKSSIVPYNPLADREVDATIDTIMARLTFKVGDLPSR